ncbi:MAG: phosphoribosylaminoimidazolesuccinocarboxamide synthase [Candidatus Micrarchaeota archaeon]|nr:phosphoribosylaminoimidazolesuccinocarboxamide synthase [Candidatus Micrarchaeota archaeon]
MDEVITKTDLKLKPFSRGKVRDTYELPDGSLFMVASDRLSAFDVVFPDGIEKKGRVLTQMSLFWFGRLKGIVDNHLISTSVPDGLPSYLEGRCMTVKKVRIIPLECVVRGYMAGSGWKDYQKTGAICGMPLPAGLKNASRLPQPIFTPSTKAEKGHDENIGEKEGAALVGKETYHAVRGLSLRIYSAAADYAKARGIILADTKFEFGADADGKIILADEVLTPDSSRYWPADSYREGVSPPSYDKQFVRDYLETTGWDKMPPAPRLPAEVMKKTTEKYVECYERLTGKKFPY